MESCYTERVHERSGGMSNGKLKTKFGKSWAPFFEIVLKNKQERFVDGFVGEERILYALVLHVVQCVLEIDDVKEMEDTALCYVHGYVCES